MPVMNAPTISELWNLCRHLRMSEVAAKYQMTTQDMVAQFKQAGLLGNGPRDPSPEEIERAKQAFQRRWTPEVRQSRWVGSRGSRLV